MKNDLHDFVPPQNRITLPGADGSETDVDVRGLSIQHISDLIARFPEVVEQFDGGLNALALLKLGPFMASAIMAYGCGCGRDADAEKVLAELPLGTQAEILSIIVRLTAPKGVGPFVELLKALGLDLATVRSAALSASQSAKPSPTSSAEATPSMN